MGFSITIMMRLSSWAMPMKLKSDDKDQLIKGVIQSNMFVFVKFCRIFFIFILFIFMILFDVFHLIYILSQI